MLFRSVKVESAPLSVIPARERELAQALKPALKANQRLFEQTEEPIRTQIRPFTRQVRPVLTHANEGSDDFSKSVRSFGNALGAFNSFLNELAYKPKGSRQSFLFYLPWLNHNLNATFNLVDAGGPISRGVAMLTCNGSDLAYKLTVPFVRADGSIQSLKPYLRTGLEGARIPAPDEIPVPGNPSGHCEFKEK